MAFLRRSGASQRVRRKSSFYTSVGIGALLLLAVGVVWCFEDGERSISQERRLDGYWDDPLIDQPYGKADNRGLVFVHIIIILYMLLGLNTVCDVYFSGSLEVMVEQWNVKPDVAGATFMAAGGSAPELFTSLIGAWLENDVGFSTIVGSAVFNVLFVIGICGFVSSDPIQLTWWPLFRDCTFYTIGLSLLAGFASDESIEFWEALVLFIAYLIYCTLMYHNTKLEAFTDVEFMRAKRVLPDDSMAWAAPGATTRPEQIPQPAPPSTPAPALQVPPESPPEDDADGQHGIGGGPSVSSLKSTGQLSSQPSTPARMGRRHSSRVPSHVHGKMKAAYIAGQGLAERHEDRMHSIGPDVAMAARRSERDLLRRASEPDRQEVSANEPSPKRNSFRYMSNPSSYISSKVTNFSPEEDPLNKKHSHTLSLNKEVKEMKLGKELSDEKEKELGLAETVPQGEGEEAQEEEETSSREDKALVHRLSLWGSSGELQVPGTLLAYITPRADAYQHQKAQQLAALLGDSFAVVSPRPLLLPHNVVAECHGSCVIPEIALSQLSSPSNGEGGRLLGHSLLRLLEDPQLQYMWVMEDDIEFRNSSDVLALMQTHAADDSDLLVIDFFPKTSRPSWPYFRLLHMPQYFPMKWHDRFSDAGRDPGHWHGALLPLLRVSRRMVEAVWALQQETGSLTYVELLLPSLALQQGLTVRKIQAQFSANIRYRPCWTATEMNKTNDGVFFHPAKFRDGDYIKC
mmetsp:Transcript_6697/g.14594  ORF Transcript_6697/g.14594 Transcript_6697/m.14594 type:complete len:743 (-) Transcript_6697:115-2343(-)